MTANDAVPGSWRHLLGPGHRGPMTVLAGGVALYATNVYVSTSLLPTAVTEIGGEALYAWATTVFLLTSVIAAVLVGRLLAAAGPVRAYLLALAAFLVGSAVAAAAPSMELLLVGRAVQGAGGGLLAGLGYALIRSALPPTLRSRASAMVSAMWGVGILVGPVLGGAFAELGSWRGAFGVLALGAVIVGLLVPRSLARHGEDAGDREPEPFPLVTLVLIAAATMTVSVASVDGRPAVALGGVVVAVVLLATMLVRERRSGRGVLPAATFRPGSPLRWVYATIAVLAVGSTVETFVPLFGQRLGGLAPLAAGALGAALAAGWTLGELPSAGVSRPAVLRRIVVASPLVVAVGLALAAATWSAEAGVIAVAAWAVGLAVAGAGIGTAWPHLATAAMASTTDPGEGAKAAAAVSTVQLLANAFGTALTGVAVNLGAPDALRSARYLFVGFAVLTALGLLAALRARRAVDPAGEPTAVLG